MGDPSEENQWSRVLAHDTEKVREWSRELASMRGHPPAGCPLEVDDAALSWQPLSASLGACLEIGLDHLRAVVALTEARSYHPAATFSLTRSALVSAAHAVYLTSPPSSRDRQARSLAYGREMLNQRKQYNDEMAGTPGVERALLIVSIRHVLMRLAGIEASRSRYGLSKRATTLPSTTKVVKHAAGVVFASGPEAAAHMTSHWMVTSSDAHALPWGMLLRGHETAGLQPPPQSGVIPVQVQGDPETTVRYFHLAALVTSWAMRRTRELRTVGRDPNAPTEVQPY